MYFVEYNQMLSEAIPDFKTRKMTIAIPASPVENLPTSELIELLRKKYNVHALEDMRLWITAEEIRTGKKLRSFYWDQLRNDILSVIFGFRPVVWLLQYDVGVIRYIKDPILQEILAKMIVLLSISLMVIHLCTILEM